MIHIFMDSFLQSKLKVAITACTAFYSTHTLCMFISSCCALKLHVIKRGLTNVYTLLTHTYTYIELWKIINSDNEN